MSDSLRWIEEVLDNFYPEGGDTKQDLLQAIKELYQKGFEDGKREGYFTGLREAQKNYEALHESDPQINRHSYILGYLDAKNEVKPPKEQE